MIGPTRVDNETELVLAALPITDPTATATSRESLDRSLVAGVAWNAVVKVVAQAAAWGSTVVVAHYLVPDDYGIVGMATFLLGLVELVTEFGIASAVGTRPDLTGSQIEELNTLSVLLGVVGTVLICASAPLVGAFFNNARLPLVVLVLSVNFLLRSFRSVPWGLLERDLRFKRLAAYDGLQSVALAGLTVALAVGGFGYWALVVASIANSVISAGLAIFRHPVGFRRPKFARLKPFVNYSGNLVVQRVAWFGYSNADFAIAGKVLGVGPLGQYTLAWTLSRVTDKFSALLMQVSPPVLSKVREKPEDLRRYMIRISEAVTLTVLPLSAGVTLVARDLVPLVLGVQWVPMVFALEVLSAYATVGVALPLMGHLLNVTGHEAWAMRHNVLQTFLMPVAFAIGAHFGGIDGLALAWVVVHPFLALRITRHALRTIDLPLRVYVRDVLVPSMVCCALMAIGVLGVRLAWPLPAPTFARLGVEISVGGTVYLGSLLLFFRQRVSEIRTFIRQVVRSARG